MDGQGKATQTLACQIDRQDSKQSILTFLLPAGSGGDLNLALDSSSVATPDALNVSPATELKDGLWIAGSRYRALLGPQGAHLYRWDVNALAGQDITMSGDVDWEGFDDVGGQRSTAFTLKAVASGPICVQIDCRSTDGLGKTLTFYAGLGWYDTRFDDPVNFFWQYDDPAVMGPTSKTPGTFRFSDGRTGSLPPDGVISYAERSSWVARFRPDGLTLGLISPESVATLRAGPGGSMGGVGVEGNEAVRHLLTYADIAPNNWTTVSDLFENALRLNKACVNMR